jgi:LPS-assembly protein
MLKWKIFCRTMLSLFLLLAASHALAASQKDIAEGPVGIEADSITYDEDEGTLHAAGKVVITFSRGFLKADTVVLNRGTNMALAEGQVLVHSDQDVLAGEKVLFNVVTKTGTATDGNIYIALNHIYVKAEKIEKKGEATYRCENATLTTCDGKNPDWRIRCDHRRLRGLKTWPIPHRRCPYLLFALLRFSRQDNAPVGLAHPLVFLLPG